MIHAIFAFLTLYHVVEMGACASIIARMARPGRRLRAPERWLYGAALAVFPTVMLVLATLLFTTQWKGDKPYGWFGVVNIGYPGATILPIWTIAAVSLVVGLVSPRRLLTSKPNFIMTATLAVVCFWYAGTYPIYSNIGLSDVTVSPRAAALGLALVLVPGWACVNLSLLLAYVWRQRQLAGRCWPFALPWAGGLAATVWAKCAAAVSYWNSLPDEPPSCFVVSAAARGHPWLTGSRANPRTGRMENLQLRRLRAFEALVAAAEPSLHRLLRRVYNAIGPAVAAGVRRRLAADAAYLLLKPLELTALCCLRGAAFGRQGDGGARGPTPGRARTNGRRGHAGGKGATG